jgi:hypothetical protein
VLLKFACWPWEVDYLEAETAAYQWIKGTGVGPKFLGHLTEGKDGRVIGFVLEWIEGARHAESIDLEGCEKALRQLHAFGMKSGDINKYNFLVRDDCDVVMVDFETVKRNCSSEELAEEMSGLKASLEDTSSRGGVEDKKPSPE